MYNFTFFQIELCGQKSYNIKIFLLFSTTVGGKPFDVQNLNCLRQSPNSLRELKPHRLSRFRKRAMESVTLSTLDPVEEAQPIQPMEELKYDPPSTATKATLKFEPDPDSEIAAFEKALSNVSASTQVASDFLPVASSTQIQATPIPKILPLHHDSSSSEDDYAELLHRSALSDESTESGPLFKPDISDDMPASPVLKLSDNRLSADSIPSTQVFLSFVASHAT